MAEKLLIKSAPRMNAPRCLPALLLFLLFPATALLPAQEAEKKTPPRQVRFLPVGDSPPFRQEVRNGVRYELEPPAGSIPPRNIRLLLGEDLHVDVRLRLGHISEATPLPPKLGKLPLQALADGKTRPWTLLNLPAAGDLLVVLFRSPTAPSWDKPASRIVSDAWNVFQEGDLRMVNVSPATLASVMGKTRLQILPGKSVKRALGPVKELPIQIAWKTKTGGWRPFYNTALAQNKGERAHLVLYRADGLRPRQPVKVLFFRERKPPPPPKTSKTPAPPPDTP